MVPPLWIVYVVFPSASVEDATVPSSVIGSFATFSFFAFPELPGPSGDVDGSAASAGNATTIARTASAVTRRIGRRFMGAPYTRSAGTNLRSR